MTRAHYDHRRLKSRQVRLTRNIPALAPCGHVEKERHSLIKSKIVETGSPLAGNTATYFLLIVSFGFDDGLYAAVRLLGCLDVRGWSTLAESSRDRFAEARTRPQLRSPVPRSENRGDARRSRPALAEAGPVNVTRNRRCIGSTQGVAGAVAVLELRKTPCALCEALNSDGPNASNSLSATGLSISAAPDDLLGPDFPILICLDHTGLPAQFSIFPLKVSRLVSERARIIRKQT